MFELIRRVFLKIKKAYSEGGIGLILKRVLAVSFETNDAWWYERDLTQPISKIDPRVSVQINFDQFSETLEWLKKDDREWMANPQEVKICLENNHYFVNAKFNNEIIAFTKICHGKVFIADYKKCLEFPKDMAFFTDLYLSPDLRSGKNYKFFAVAAYLETVSLKFAKEMGFKRVRCHIPEWNKAARDFSCKLGFVRIKHVRLFRIFSFKILTANPIT
jgi:hypothetical protein